MAILENKNDDMYIDPVIKLEIYENYKAYIDFIKDINLDKSAFKILLMLKFNVMGAFFATGKMVNEELARQDVSFLEYTSDYLVNEIYPKYIGHYVLPVEKDDGVIFYEECPIRLEQSILYTEVLDQEFLYLNTCINIMKMSNGNLTQYIDAFSKGYTSGLYKTVYELIQFAYDHSTYSDIINCYDVPKNLVKYSTKELTFLKAYSDAMLKLIKLPNRNNKEDYEKHLDANDAISDAYQEKIKNGKSNRFSRNR